MDDVGALRRTPEREIEENVRSRYRTTEVLECYMQEIGCVRGGKVSVFFGRIGDLLFLLDTKC